MFESEGACILNSVASTLSSKEDVPAHGPSMPTSPLHQHVAMSDIVIFAPLKRHTVS